MQSWSHVGLAVGFAFMADQFALEKILRFSHSCRVGNRPQKSTPFRYEFSQPQKIGPIQPGLLKLPITPDFRQTEAVSLPIASDAIIEKLE